MKATTSYEGALCAICGEIESGPGVVLRQYSHADGAFALLACRGCANAVDYVCDQVEPRVARGVLAPRVAQLIRRMIIEGDLQTRGAGT